MANRTRVRIGCQTNLEFWFEADMFIDTTGQLTVENCDGRLPIEFHLAQTMGIGRYMKLLRNSHDNFDVSIMEHEENNVYDVRITAQTNMEFWFEMDVHLTKNMDCPLENLKFMNFRGRLPIDKTLASFLGEKYMRLLQHPQENFQVILA